MTNEQKVTMVQTLVGDDPEVATAALIDIYLQIACHKMLERLYPYDTDKTESDIPSRYDMLQCELGARLYSRRGGEGEISHEENGVNRAYASVDDEDILSRLTPFAKVGG